MDVNDLHVKSAMTAGTARYLQNVSCVVTVATGN